MGQEGMSRIGEKFQELLAVIKEEAGEETKEARAEILKAVNELKQIMDEKWQDLGEQSKERLGDIGGKALKAQYTIQEKYSQGLEKKDEVVAKTADGLVEAVKKVKESLLSEKK